VFVVIVISCILYALTASGGSLAAELTTKIDAFYAKLLAGITAAS